MDEDIVKLLSRPGSPIILVVFVPERRYLIPIPFNMYAKYRVCENFAIYD